MLTERLPGGRAVNNKRESKPWNGGERKHNLSDREKKILAFFDAGAGPDPVNNNEYNDSIYWNKYSAVTVGAIVAAVESPIDMENPPPVSKWDTKSRRWQNRRNRVYSTLRRMVERNLIERVDRWRGSYYRKA